MTIDWWTLGLQTVNIAILIWLLARFFWRPMAAMIAQRRADAQKLLDDAAAKRTEAAAALAEIERTRAGFAGERDTILSAAQVAAGQTRAEMLADAQREAASLRAQAQADAESDRDRATAAWRGQAAALAVDIARRLAARLDGPAVRAAFLHWLEQELRALPEAARRALTDSGAGLEAISATALPPSERDACQQMIAAVLGAAVPVRFRTDPALIAGLELRGPHVVVSNSWSADLAQILTGLNHAG